MTKKNNFENHIYRCKPLKNAPLDGTFPEDFWNYAINPITGYPYEALKDHHGNKIKKKYGQLQQADPTVKINRSIDY